MSGQAQQMQTSMLSRLSLEKHNTSSDNDSGSSANFIPPPGLEGGGDVLSAEDGDGVFVGINSGELMSFIRSAGNLDASVLGGVGGFGSIFKFKGIMRQNLWSQLGGNMSPFKMSVGASFHGMGMEGKEFALPSLSFSEGTNVSPGLSATRADAKSHGQQ